MLFFFVLCQSNCFGRSFTPCQSTKSEVGNDAQRNSGTPNSHVLIKISSPWKINLRERLLKLFLLCLKSDQFKLCMSRYLGFTGVRRLSFGLPRTGRFFFQHQGGGNYACPPPLELRRERVEKSLPFSLRCRPLLHIFLVRCGGVVLRWDTTC